MLNSIKKWAQTHFFVNFQKKKHIIKKVNKTFINLFDAIS